LITNQQYYYYLKDRLGSVVGLINNNRQLVESYHYNTFGKLTIKDHDQNIIPKSNYNNPYAYTGRRFDNESGLYYYRNRYYQPSLARFISQDPKGYIDGYNLYAYAKNNPLKYTDPFGTTAQQTNYDYQEEWGNWGNDDDWDNFGDTSYWDDGDDNSSDSQNNFNATPVTDINDQLSGASNLTVPITNTPPIEGGSASNHLVNIQENSYSTPTSKKLPSSVDSTPKKHNYKWELIRTVYPGKTQKVKGKRYFKAEPQNTNIFSFSDGFFYFAGNYQLNADGWTIPVMATPGWGMYTSGYDRIINAGKAPYGNQLRVKIKTNIQPVSGNSNTNGWSVNIYTSD
ncbi:RHS repeat-associated core domain-containing protein, partial [Bathymodiolus thermophilus thioautotrophic gill symbiont]